MVQKIAPTSFTPSLEYYHRRQLEVEGKVTPKAIEATKAPVLTKGKKDKQPEDVLETNYKKWANNPADIPFVRRAIFILKMLSESADMELSVEEQHNLEVLSSQTDKLLTDWYETPERIRTLPQVDAAFKDQLTQIAEGVNSMTDSVTQNLVRNLNAGTGFIQAKFNPPKL